MTPRSRVGLIARPVGDELVVYDASTYTAHCLNRTAALVFRAADGRTSVARLAAILSERSEVEVPEAVVHAALRQLSEANLLEGEPDAPAARSSRREVLRKVGIGMAVLTPAVVSLIVPTPAEALNTCIPAAGCTTLNQGQPCYNLAQVECATKQCTGAAGDCQ